MLLEPSSEGEVVHTAANLLMADRLRRGTACLVCLVGQELIGAGAGPTDLVKVIEAIIIENSINCFVSRYQ